MGVEREEAKAVPNHPDNQKRGQKVEVKPFPAPFQHPIPIRSPMTATVIYPGDHVITVTFEGREVSTNRVQLVFAKSAVKLHLTGLRHKTSPVAFLNRTFGTRKTAKFWQQYLEEVLA